MSTTRSKKGLVLKFLSFFCAIAAVKCEKLRPLIQAFSTQCTLFMLKEACEASTPETQIHDLCMAEADTWTWLRSAETRVKDVMIFERKSYLQRTGQLAKLHSLLSVRQISRRSPSCHVVLGQLTSSSFQTEESKPQHGRPLELVDEIEKASSFKNFLVLPRLDRDFFLFFGARQAIQAHIAKMQVRVRFGYLHFYDEPSASRLLCDYSEVSGIKTVVVEGTAFPDCASNMYGRNYRVVPLLSMESRLKLFEYEPGKYDVERGSYEKLLLLLGQKLNFTTSYQQGSNNGTAGIKQSNGTWTGVASDILYGRADMAVILLRTYSRNALFTWSVAFEYLNIIMVTAPPSPVFSAKYFIEPFPLEVYAAVVALMACVIGSLYLGVFLYRKESDEVPKAPEARSILGFASMIVHYFFGSFFIQAVNVPQNGKVVSAFWFMFVIILCNAYLSELFFFMTFPSYEPVPTTFEELAESDYKYSLWSYGGSSYMYFKKGTTPAIKTIFQNMVEIQDVRGCLKYATKPKRACLAYNVMVDYVIRTDMFSAEVEAFRKLTIAKESTLSLPACVTMREQAVALQGIDPVLYRVISAHVHEQMVKYDLWAKRLEEVQRKMLNLYETVDRTNEKIIEEEEPFLGQMIGVAYVVCIGWLVSTPVFVIEMIVKILKKRIRVERKLKPEPELKRQPSLKHWSNAFRTVKRICHASIRVDYISPRRTPSFVDLEFEKY